MTDRTEDLRRRWPAALADRAAVREDLLDAYADPARGYHDLRHLAEVLDRLAEMAAAGVAVPAEVIAAAWFHDGVYDGSDHAEEASARWAESALAGSSVDAAEVGRLVRLTVGHRPEPRDDSGGVLCDADLAILASPPTRYAEYVADVRREYAHVADADFAAGRAAVLADLAAKEWLFHTAYARERWEAAARGNLERERAELRQAGTGLDPGL